MIKDQTLLLGFVLGALLTLLLRLAHSLFRRQKTPARQLQRHLREARARAAAQGLQTYLVRIQVTAGDQQIMVMNAVCHYLQHCTRREEAPLRQDDSNVFLILVTLPASAQAAQARLRERMQGLRVLDAEGQPLSFEWRLECVEATP